MDQTQDLLTNTGIKAMNQHPTSALYGAELTRNMDVEEQGLTNQSFKSSIEL